MLDYGHAQNTTGRMSRRKQEVEDDDDGYARWVYEDEIESEVRMTCLVQILGCSEIGCSDVGRFRNGMFRFWVIHFLVCQFLGGSVFGGSVLKLRNPKPH